VYAQIAQLVSRLLIKELVTQSLNNVVQDKEDSVQLCAKIVLSIPDYLLIEEPAFNALRIKLQLLLVFAKNAHKVKRL